MPKPFISAAQFSELARAGSIDGARVFSASAFAPELPNDNGRLISYQLSNDSVARDGHTIAPDGWQLGNFSRNPVFLWAHDDGEPPIGKFIDIGVVNRILRGTVEYADADVYPFADTIFRLVKGGFINAVSVSWMPLKWKYSTDKSRGGGVDFLEQDLLEVSQVPVPAAPNSLVTARSSGIDTGPLYEWAERVLDTGDTILIPRSELESLRRDAKMPTTKTRAASTEVPSVKRGLWTVSYLAELLQTLGWIQESSEWEEAYEEDDSPVPQMLADALKNLGQILIAMTVEEVGELVGGDDTDVAMEDEAFVQAAKTPSQRALRGMVVSARAAKTKPADTGFVRVAIESAIKQFASANPTFGRAGRVLSGDNEKTLRAAHGMITDACGLMMGVVEQAAPVTGDEPAADPDEDAGEQSRAMAKVTVLKLRG